MPIKTKNKGTSRVNSFSVPDGDTSGAENVKKLKEYCKKSGQSFSFLVLKGIEHINKELGLLNKDK